MIPAQPILIAVLAIITILYFTRLRSKAADGLIIILVFTCALVLVARPELATRLAQAVGIGRGVDLILYLSIPGLAFLILVLFSKQRKLDEKLTAMVREDALGQVMQSSSKRSNTP